MLAGICRPPHSLILVGGLRDFESRRREPRLGLGDAGDGVIAQMSVRQNNSWTVVFKKEILPAPRRSAGNWVHVQIDLSAFTHSPMELKLQCFNLEGNSIEADWVAWNVSRLEVNPKKPR